MIWLATGVGFPAGAGRPTAICAAGRVELSQANSTFHAAVGKLSGNCFIVQLISRQNQFRRLLEYRVSDDHERIAPQCEEHLAILNLPEQGERTEAARLLAAHLAAAGEDKVRQIRMEGETP
ncbi:MAG TPA: FCD domain-containing protein [Aliidongia sp.]|nr:FCD domain-containing protein [Aliidongia sp.]